MKTKNKYGARTVYWNIQENCIVKDFDEVIDCKKVFGNKYDRYYQRFDSIFEATVYSKLRECIPAGQVKCQVPVLLVPQGTCYPNGRYWKVDFEVQLNPANPRTKRYVEVKGFIQRDFALTLAMLEQASPEVFNNLSVVFQNYRGGNDVLNRLQDAPTKSGIFNINDFDRLIATMRGFR